MLSGAVLHHPLTNTDTCDLVQISLIYFEEAHVTIAVGRQFWRVDQYRRQALITPDGGLIALDWFQGCDTASHIDQSAPVLLVFHGLTGETDL